VGESTRLADGGASENRRKPARRLGAVKSGPDSSDNGMSMTVEPVTILTNTNFPTDTG
jgi:hypothetical protein